MSKTSKKTKSARKGVSVKKREDEKLLVLSVLAAVFAVAFLVVVYYAVDVNAYIDVMMSSSNSVEAQSVDSVDDDVSAVEGTQPVEVDETGDYWFDNLNEDEFTEGQCVEIKRIWDMGYWTGNYSSLYAPEACKALGFWGTVSGTDVQPPEDYVGNMYVVYEENPFPDTDENTVEGVAAAYLYNIGLINGYPDGEFKGDNPVNRAEAAKFLLNARYSVVPELANDGTFSDVESGQWYESFVMYAAQLGIINGYDDGTFRPADTVNTAEFLKMLTLTFDLDLNLPYAFTDVDAGAWYEQYVGTADKYNLFPYRGNQLDPGSLLTRDEVATAIFQFLSYSGQ